MKKIEFNIDDQTLSIGYKVENNAIKNFNNTNIISTDDLIFDIKYFKSNISLIAGFLNVIVKSEEIENAIIKEESLIIPSLELLSYMPSIKNLVIAPDIPIDYDIHMAILKNDTLKTINCFTIPPYLLERIDTTKNVKIETRNEVFFISNFLRVNRLASYTEVFYKRKLTVTYEFNASDWQDFRSFLTINTHLKTIYFEYASIGLIKDFLKILKDFDRKNIVFLIKGNKNNLSIFQDIESLVKKNKFIKKNNIKFKIDYTQDYKMENFLKLLNFTTVKYIFVVVIISAILGYGINRYDLYKSSEEVDAISENISTLLEEYREYDIEELGEPESQTEPDTENDTPTTPTPEPPKIDYSSYYKDYSKVISILKETNSDTVGWITVPGTSVNYPVVQSINNSYYLNHDFNKNLNSYGWTFMDYRNDVSNLNQNTIIYGHNISVYSNVMFGSLRLTLEEAWYKNTSNTIITFNTAAKDMKWKVFSVYKVENTNDYLYNTFTSQQEFLEFTNKLKSRSIYDFGVDIHENDKILTLSTCQNSGKMRLAIHAVLIQE